MNLVALTFAAWKHKQNIESEVMASMPIASKEGILEQTAANAIALRHHNARVVHSDTEIDEKTGAVVLQAAHLTHAGEDFWNEYKNRLAEHGILVDDDQMAVAAAGFHAEKALQSILGYENMDELQQELLSNPMINDLHHHPEAHAAFAEVSKDFPRLPWSATLAQAIEYHPNVLEVSPEPLSDDVIWGEES
jgi:hypothetical protein